ncbi:hypothetical protein M5K25_004232 [Dendrobium thyrsiflorum]|uniref:Uncharacterized protein n=1 Tax=Dendrobium thyrsiflorum TaxID=117978 RepID=A0ABD0VLC0_DENTH
MRMEKEDVHEKRREKLKEDVKLLIKVKNFADQLELFDSLQKLGVAYHFEEEIKYLLNLMKYSEEKLKMEFNEDIHVMALYFRLLREHGFEVSKGGFSYTKLVPLFGTKIPMGDITSTKIPPGKGDRIVVHSEGLKKTHKVVKADDVKYWNILERWGKLMELPISLHVGAEDLLKMLNLPDIDTLYYEVHYLSMWWTEVSNVFDSKLNFARDWPVESYFLAVGMTVEPQFSTCRKELAKALCFINVIDDIYDIYGLLDELQLFTKAIDRYIIKKNFEITSNLYGELQRGDVSKSIQCYMKENHVSELVAQECIRNIIKKYWKELNREWIKGSRYEETFKTVAINIPRVGHLFYLQSNDGNIGELNVEEMKDNTISLLLEPITFKQGV